MGWDWDGIGMDLRVVVGIEHLTVLIIKQIAKVKAGFGRVKGRGELSYGKTQAKGNSRERAPEWLESESDLDVIA